MTAPDQLNVALMNRYVTVVILKDEKLKPCPKAFRFVAAEALVVRVGEKLDGRQVLQKLFGQRLDVS